MATPRRHVSSAPFPAPGVAASLQRAVTAAQVCGANPACVHALLTSSSGRAYRVALDIVRVRRRAEAALRAVRLLEG